MDVGMHGGVNVSECDCVDYLYLATVDNQTDYLIIGDSCLNKLSPDKMNTGQFNHTQKICISGIRASEIYNWIQTQPIYPNVKKLVIHAGVNDVDQGIICQEMWSNLISVLQTKFPHAHISMSSIIPFKSNTNQHNYTPIKHKSL